MAILHRLPSVAATVAVALAACGPAPYAKPSVGASPSGAAASSPVQVVARTVGDSATFGARIESVDYAQRKAWYTLGAPAYVVMLSVIPNKAIVALSPIPPASPVFARAGSYVVPVRAPLESDLRRPDVGAMEGDQYAGAQSEYDRCVANGIRARTPVRAPPVKRDSAGRVIEQPGKGEQADPDIVTERNVEASCASAMRGELQRRQQVASGGPSREIAGDRYLVMFASRLPVDSKHVAELTVVEGDINSIVQAIGKKFYGAIPVQWAAYYRSW